jgi:hypothetical protein
MSLLWEPPLQPSYSGGAKPKCSVDEDCYPKDSTEVRPEFQPALQVRQKRVHAELVLNSNVQESVPFRGHSGQGYAHD